MFAILSSRTFGEFSRYRLEVIRDRFGGTWFHVSDAETPDELGLPTIIRQSRTEAEALAGLL